jgi:hypothetical protein
MRELSHSDQILKLAKSQRSNWKKVNDYVIMTSPSYFHDADMAEVGGDIRRAGWIEDVGVDQ